MRKFFYIALMIGLIAIQTPISAKKKPRPQIAFKLSSVVINAKGMTLEGIKNKAIKLIAYEEG